MVTHQDHVQQRAESLFRAHLNEIHRQTDRLFAWLLVGQWMAAIGTALWISPRAWAGAASSIHVHVWAAVLLGGLLVAPPVSLAVRWPGRAFTRQCIAVAQMLMGALLIHLTGGRIETHFHVFGSLAFLAFYRDWRVLITASAVVAADHLLRGLFYPQSVFGVASASPWRWLEHAGWVVFENCFLILACRRGIQEMHAIAQRQAKLENTNSEIEQIVDQRTAELRERSCQLQEQQKRTEQIIMTANDAFVETDQDGVITDWNPKAEALFGWSKAQAVGRRLASLILPPAEGRAHDESRQRYLTSGHGSFTGKQTEVKAVNRNGQALPTEFNIWAMGSGAEIRFNAFIRDITQRKQVEEALRQAKESAEAANRAKSEFLANMSHEIRTPMNGIIGMTQLALRTELTPVQREYLDMVARSAEALLGIINDILDFSKIEAGKLMLDPVPFSLCDCVEGLVKDLSIRSLGKGLELTNYLAPGVPDAIVGDPGRLRQVLINLVGNAIKFTQRGEVSVILRPVAPALGAAHLRFEVRDTGIGIPPDKIQRIFQAFEQADTTTARTYGGTGLGLTISAKLIALMGGTLQVQSEVGRGSSFFFELRLPLADQAMRRRPVAVLPKLEGVRVLVVDDNATNRQMLHDLLLSWRMRPSLCAGGAVALESLSEAAEFGQPFELVLLDAMMPELDGFAVAEFIRQHRDYAQATVMMLSSADRHEDVERCRALGVDSYLTKPVSQSDLFDAIVNALHLRASSFLVASGGAGAAAGNGRGAAAGAAAGNGRGAAAGAAAGNGRGAAPPPLVNLSGLHILLAEDNPVNQKLAERILEMKGLRITTVGNGREALEALARERFDLVLMDVQMPELDGLEATRAIRAREREAADRLPIIAMTAHALKGDRERCLEAGMDGYVSKPVNPDALWKEIAAVLAQRAAAPARSADPAPAAVPPIHRQPISNSVLDGSRVDSLWRLSPDGALLRELVEMFQEQCPELMAELRQAIDDRDALGVNQKAHRLKGALNGLGSVGAARAAEELEQLGKAGALAEASARFDCLVRDVSRFRAALEQMCKGHGSSAPPRPFAGAGVGQEVPSGNLASFGS